MNSGNIVINSLVLLLAVLLFTQGFLLLKLEIGRRTTCEHQNSAQTAENGDCWSLTSDHYKYKKLVLMIVDALRYDFAFFQEDSSTLLPFHNKLPVFHDLIKTGGCRKARLWRFLADAPTTTMQRLKGLTTGSLPTFIDLSRNFASSEILEDNIIDQFKSSGKNITFMGDDTWMNLFPGRFNKAFPYPSFDVKDLHLVDDGIMKHLLPELKTENWQILIAHFLGVDHCGHRYSPFHPEMSSKLQQMNGIIEEVVHTIDNETLLLVMGDHGMTPTGDHGGETYNEVNSAMFAYSPVGAFKECETDGEKDAVVNQVDIVPTLSLLLGTPIPFANLGVVIEDMLPEYGTDLGAAPVNKSKMFHEALVLNAMQIHTYLSAYQEISNSFPHDIYSSLERSYKEVEELFHSGMELNKFTKQNFLQYMASARHMCQLVWARFNVGLMMCALGLPFLWFISNFDSNILPFSAARNKILVASIFITSVLTISSLSSSVNDSLCMLMCCSTMLFFFASGFCSLWKSCSNISLFELAFPVVFLSLYSVSYTTNSFILNEDILTLYLFVSTFLCLPFAIVYCKQSADIVKMPRTDKLSADSVSARSPLFVQSYIKLLIYSVITLVCARVALLFRRCRAEQFWCFDDSNSSDIDAKMWYDTVKLLMSCIGLAACVSLVLHSLSKYSSSKICTMNTLLLVSATAVICDWLLQMTPSKLRILLPDWHVTVFPRLSYVVLLVHFVFLGIDPVYQSVMCYEKQLSRSSHTNQKVEQDACDKDVNERLEDSVSDMQTLTNAFTTSIISAVLGLIILFCMLLGPGSAASLTTWAISAFCVLELMSVMMHHRRCYAVPFGCVILWNILCSYWWFATGHQASISSIRWDAAFVGFQGNHATNLIPAILLLLETFSMQILSTVSLPLAVFWPPTDGEWHFKKEWFRKRSSAPHLIRKVEQLDAVFRDLFLKHYFYHVAKMIGCMLCACLHRRHLMVWQIFAPRYVFEGLSLIIVLFTSLVVYAFVCKVRKKAGLVTKVA